MAEIASVGTKIIYISTIILNPIKAPISSFPDEPAHF